MSSLSRLKASPGLLIRALVALGAAAAIAAAAARFAAGRPALGADVAEELVVLVIVGALARRFGIALPGTGFTSYMLGVMAYATLDRGWPFGVVVALVAMVVGDVALRRLPLAAALDNGAHLTRATTTPKDRKSTRLNSSHRCISYAVFCLKKKNRFDDARCFS